MKKLVFALALAMMVGIVSTQAQDKKVEKKPATTQTATPAPKAEPKKEAKPAPKAEPKKEVKPAAKKEAAPAKK